MTEQRLIDELVARAADDADRFRRDHPGEKPSTLWMENSYTAALPLAKDAAQFDPGPDVHPRLFDVYKTEITRRVGSSGEDSEASRKEGDELVQQPTRGEW
ncbi:MAG TPA: hypothetical protein VF618_07410 [Thermoanaerobaculia bacterium]